MADKSDSNSKGATPKVNFGAIEISTPISRPLAMVLIIFLTICVAIFVLATFIFANSQVEQVSANSTPDLNLTFVQTQTREVQLTETATTRPSDTPTHALSPDLGLFLAQTQTFEAQLAELARLTNTPPPTLLPAEGLALTPVVNNADWTPYERDFDGVAMVLVPAGCFMMGSTDAQIDDAYSAYVTEYGENFDMRGLFETESPQHEQCFETPFWVDKYEVTQVQFRQFNGQKVNENGFTGDDLPVEQITWFEARDYCEW